MKKAILTILLCGFMVLGITGCGKEEDNFEHYDLKNKDLNTYIYYSDERGQEKYVLADITPTPHESFLTGLFYKVSENDYILLETLEHSQKDAYKKNYIYQFYKNKLYGVGNGSSPMIFEIELNGTQSKIKKLEFKVDGKSKTNPFLIMSIQKINNDEILYYGYATFDGNNDSAKFSCSLSTYECTITKDN